MRLERLRVLDDDRTVVRPELDPGLPDAELVRLYRAMLLVRLLDERLLKLQRQGRIGFYLTALGEEAAVIGAAAPLRPSDWIFSCYRETGAALLRGYPLRTLLCQLFGNAEDPVKGRQMPIHHSIRAQNFVSVSSPVGTQIPHAVGAAMAARLSGKDDVALTYFGDGATSTGAFHVSCNLAAVRKAPVVFFCRNNGWAISTPRAIQTATPTLAQKAVAYGLPGVLVDGNDVLAVVRAVRDAADRARRGDGPTLIEAVTYRRGAHSSSDDPSVYRDGDEVKLWERKDPLARFRRHLAGRGLWSDADETRASDEIAATFAATLAEVERVPPAPPRASLFDDVFAARTWLQDEQAAELARVRSS